MRNSLPMHPMMFKAAVLVTCLLLVMVYNKSKAQRPAIKHITATKVVVR